MINLHRNIACLFRNIILPLLVTSCMSPSTPPYNYEYLLRSGVVGHHGEISDAMCFEAVIDTENPLSKKLNDGSIFFSLKSSGFVPGSRFSLYMTRVQEKPCFLCDLIADENGEFIIVGKESIFLKNHLFGIFGHMLGEESTYSIVSADGSIYMSASIGNNPIRMRGKDNALVAMKIITRNVDLFSLQGERFIPGEKLDIISNTCGEKEIYQLIVDVDGKWRCSISPTPKGFKGGEGMITLKREDGEILRTKYLWGEKARNISY